MVTAPILVCPSTPEDAAALQALYEAAFLDENLVPLLRALIAADGVLSLVARRDGLIVGHVAFTRCRVEGSGADLALLGPLAVRPAAQRQGVGRTLVAEGCRRLAVDDVAAVFVLGDPAYYGRLGFRTEANVRPPYPLPEIWQSAWQSRSLHGAFDDAGGSLIVPAVWQRPELWGP